MRKDTLTSDKLPAPLDISLAELLVIIPIAASAAIILIAYLLDMAGWPIGPRPVGAVLIVTALLAAGLLWRWGRRVRVRVRWGELAGLSVIFVGLPVYVYWLSGGSWLPANGNPDTANHMLLSNFIMDHASLPHDPRLWQYLGDFATYSPGSHIIAALTGRVFGTVSLYTIEPIMTLVAVLRSAVFYLIALRLLKPHTARPLLALAGTILLLAAYWYVINSFMWFFYYAQVMSELFALAMLAALVAWNDRPWFGPLVGFSLCGIAVWLTWPLWLPVPVLALAALLALRSDLALRRRAIILALTVLPIAVVVVVYTAGRTSGLSILAAEGGVTTPSPEVFGWPMLILAVVGIATSWQVSGVRVVLLFTAVLLIEIAAFVILDTVHQVQTYYQAYKMFYLLVYPVGLFATLGLAAVWQWLAQRWPATSIPLAAALPLVALALAYGNGLPREPVVDPSEGTFTEPLYATVTWARQNLPAGCVDYLVDYWVTAYWLHLELGNPMAGDQLKDIILHYEDRLKSPNRWTRPRGFPYAIVEDMASVPEDVRSHFKVLYESGPSAVVYRTGECDDDTVPLQNYPLAPRTNTVAARLDGWLGTRLAAY